MQTVLLQRFESSDHGTLGRVFIDSLLFCWSLEPPDRDNQTNRSCIPVGRYRCVWHKSPKYGWVYRVTGVPGRGHILIHPGNLGGDVLKGYLTHTKGCLLLGRRGGWLNNQRAVLVSRPTVRKFFQKMGKHDFMLEIDEDLICGN